MNPSESPQDRNDTVIDSQITQESKNAVSSVEPNESLMTRKKWSLKKKVLIILLGLIIAIPIIIAGIIAISLILYMFQHSSEQNKLRTETITLFRESEFKITDFECHDVELLNQCSFNTTESPNAVTNFLLLQQFREDNTYGDGYRKGNLYVSRDDTNSHRYYSAYRMK